MQPPCAGIFYFFILSLQIPNKTSNSYIFCCNSLTDCVATLQMYKTWQNFAPLRWHRKLQKGVSCILLCQFLASLANYIYI